MFPRPTIMRRGAPLLRGALVGSTGFFAGRTTARNADPNASQDPAIKDLQSQNAAPQYSAPPQAHAPPQPPQAYASSQPPQAYASSQPPQAYASSQVSAPSPSFPAPQTNAPPQPAAPTADDLSARLARLASLHADGVLTDQEFSAAKGRVLGT
jgi:hypothetical protein